jgi:hypothetical protein
MACSPAGNPLRRPDLRAKIKQSNVSCEPSFGSSSDHVKAQGELSLQLLTDDLRELVRRLLVHHDRTAALRWRLRIEL